MCHYTTYVYTHVHTRTQTLIPLSLVHIYTYIQWHSVNYSQGMSTDFNQFFQTAPMATAQIQWIVHRHRMLEVKIYKCKILILATSKYYCFTDEEHHIYKKESCGVSAVQLTVKPVSLLLLTNSWRTPIAFESRAGE